MKKSIWFLAAAAVGLLALHMVLLASAMPVVRHLTVHARNWPVGAPPLKLVLVSDLHVATPGDSPEHLARVVAQVNTLQPDLVLIAGDFLSNGELLARSAPVDAAVAPLRGIEAPLGALAVLGNHDYGDRTRLAEALARNHVTLLENDAIRRGPLAIVGVADAETRHDRVPESLAQAAMIGGLPIVLTHSPDLVPKLPAGIDLVLAGHTHCGQISLPWIGPLATSLRSGRRYACGLIQDGERTTLVTAGLGTSNLPIRLGAVPDLWVIDIGR